MPLGPLVKTPRRIPFIAILSTSRSELSKHRDDDRERHRRCRRGATHLRDNRWFGNRFGEDSLDHLPGCAGSTPTTWPSCLCARTRRRALVAPVPEVCRDIAPQSVDLRSPAKRRRPGHIFRQLPVVSPVPAFAGAQCLLILASKPKSSYRNFCVHRCEIYADRSPLLASGAFAPPGRISPFSQP